MITSIDFINDRPHLNNRYRSSIMQKFAEAGYLVRSFGIFSLKGNYFAFYSFEFRSLIKLKIQPSYFDLSIAKFSRYSKWTRPVSRSKNISISYFRVVEKKRHQCVIFIQNYADFRYFRRYSNACVRWCPGSGGVARESGGGTRTVVISRPGKFELVSESVSDFCSKTGREIYIVGCERKFVEAFNLDKKIIGVGFAQQSRIFESARFVFQPEGYGEGIPHSVVDGLCSGLTVIMTRSQFTQFGLAKLGFTYLLGPDIYISVIPNPEINAISQVTVDDKVFGVVMNSI